ncbi:MAG: sensor histidine kinase [Myxococcota bacterium]
MMQQGRGVTLSLHAVARHQGARHGGQNLPEIAEEALDRLLSILPVERAAVLRFESEWEGTRVLASWPPGRPDGASDRDLRQRIWEQSGAIVSLPLLDGSDRVGLLTFTLGEPDGYGPSARAACADLATHLAARLSTALQQQRGGPPAGRDAHREGAENQSLRERVRTLEAANERLREQKAELEAFAQSVSHDLMSPVRTIRSAAEALVQEASSPADDRVHEHARRIEETAHRLGRMMDDLLAYSRLGRVRERLVPIDLHEVVDEALAQLRGEIEQTAATVRIAEPLPRVWGHHSVLVQAVMNLVGNAIKFVPAGRTPRVAIRGWIGPDTGRLLVRDNGIGIARAQLARVFRAFERLHGEDAYPGSGLGLAIVQRGVAGMGGQVGVDSTPGEGSTFWLELPLAE